MVRGRTRRELETVREQIPRPRCTKIGCGPRSTALVPSLLKFAGPQRTSGKVGGAGLGSGQRGGANEKGIDGDTLAEVCCGHRHRFSFIARRL
jgi:hypothetical protein